MAFSSIEGAGVETCKWVVRNLFEPMILLVASAGLMNRF